MATWNERLITHSLYEVHCLTEWVGTALLEWFIYCWQLWYQPHVSEVQKSWLPFHSKMSSLFPPNVRCKYGTNSYQWCLIPPSLSDFLCCPSYFWHPSFFTALSSKLSPSNLSSLHQRPWQFLPLSFLISCLFLCLYLICLSLPPISTAAVSLHLPADRPISAGVQSLLCVIGDPTFLSLFTAQLASLSLLAILLPFLSQFLLFNRLDVVDSPSLCLCLWRQRGGEKGPLAGSRYFFMFSVRTACRRHFIVFQRLKQSNHKQHEKAAQPDICRQCCKRGKKVLSTQTVWHLCRAGPQTG